MIQIYEARDSTEAQYVKGLLEAEDIHAVVMGVPLETVLGDLPFSTLPTVHVNEADLAAAKQIIDELNNGGPAHTNPQVSWKCPTCGEVLEGQFTTCWKCGYNRPRPEGEE